jgi:hypothetical protein
MNTLGWYVSAATWESLHFGLEQVEAHGIPVLVRLMDGEIDAHPGTYSITGVLGFVSARMRK